MSDTKKPDFKLTEKEEALFTRLKQQWVAGYILKDPKGSGPAVHEILDKEGIDADGCPKIQHRRYKADQPLTKTGWRRVANLELDLLTLDREQIGLLISADGDTRSDFLNHNLPGWTLAPGSITWVPPVEGQKEESSREEEGGYVSWEDFRSLERMVVANRDETRATAKRNEDETRASLERIEQQIRELQAKRPGTNNNGLNKSAALIEAAEEQDEEVEHNEDTTDHTRYHQKINAVAALSRVFHQTDKNGFAERHTDKIHVARDIALQLSMGRSITPRQLATLRQIVRRCNNSTNLYAIGVTTEDYSILRSSTVVDKGKTFKYIGVGLFSEICPANGTTLANGTTSHGT